ncbi:SDR family oxidoreductase [Aquamicrobium sp. LC103]|uniref:SDR family NAD(P)-dependent oxidoreductase n=1 Tax=Aquamicrobium sp. LC103 TaxID=1120658 RepID=UPI001FEDC093|nr:SDR family oxidoreductase [Aquamicrobium sp. LC103]
MARDGFRVLAADLDLAAAEQIVVGLEGDGHRAARLDVTDEGAVADLFAAAGDDGEIASVIAAAGILLFAPNGERPPITDIKLEDWELTQRVNSTGTFLLLREYLRARTVRPVPAGRFVGFSSVAAQLGGYRSSAAYIASKNAVLGLIKAGAREAAPLGITVNAVAPGLIDAPMLRLSLPPEQDGAVSAAIPLGRIGTPEDVAGAVSFLLGSDAAYLTGAVIDVNGGYRMQ